MNQDNIDIQEVLQEKEQKKKDEKYNAYVKNHTPKKSDWRIYLCRRTGSFECLYEFGDGKRNSGIIYDIIADFSQCAVYRFEFISEACQFCRCRNDCTDYRICQFSSRTGN